MQGKVIVITGATSGIGEIAAERLASMGARLILVARSLERGQRAMARLRERNPDVSHSIYYADLSVLAEMKRVAADIAAAEARIDVLINNAGALFGSRRVTADGLELTFATNHLAYFMLTHELRERLRASAPARVINTTSAAHRGVGLDFHDLQSARSFHGFTVYRRSKLCNILFTRELARQWAGTAITVNCFHPGFVATRFADESGGLFSRVVRMSSKVFAISPEKGAETLVYLSSSPSVVDVTGGYFYKCRPVQPSKEAQDDKAALRLWQESKRLGGV